MLCLCVLNYINEHVCVCPCVCGVHVWVWVGVACVILVRTFFSACALKMFHYDHMILGACVVHVYKRGVCAVLEQLYSLVSHNGVWVNWLS